MSHDNSHSRASCDRASTSSLSLPAFGPCSAPVHCAEMATKVHSVEAEGQIEGSDDEYWPAIEILAERKGDYLVNCDGINPDTGRAWTPSWTSKTVVTEDLVEAWEAKKAAKKKGSRRGVPSPWYVVKC